MSSLLYWRSLNAADWKKFIGSERKRSTQIDKNRSLKSLELWIVN